MKRLFCNLIMLCAVIFLHSSVIANTYPTPGGYDYLKGCFGEERKNPVHDHKGVDLVGPSSGVIQGIPVFAFRKGVIIFAGNTGNDYGNYVLISHDDGTQTRYAHLDTISNDFEQKYENWNIEQDPKKKEELYKQLEVTEGQEIGKVGNTGCGDCGPHLHFEIIKSDGISLDDPQKYLDLQPRPNETLPGCGYPQVKSMDVIAQTRVKKGYKILVECQTKGLVVYGKLEGDRVTKLYLDEYARMSIDGAEIKGEFKDEGKNKGQYQYKGDFEFGEHKVELKVLNYEDQEVSRGDVTFEIVPSLEIKALLIDATKMVAKGETTYIGVKNATVKSTIEAKEEGASLTEELLKGKVELRAASAGQVLTPTVTITADGKAEVTGEATGLEDGMHTATVEVMDENGEVTDSKQKVFLVDTTAPEILKDQLGDFKCRVGPVAAPEPKESPRGGKVGGEIPIREQGSGVERVEVIEAGKTTTFSAQPVVVREGDQLFFLLAVDALPYGERTVTLRVYDRAGNVGEKTYRFRITEAPTSDVIGRWPEENSEKIRSYCFWERYGGTLRPEPLIQFMSDMTSIGAPLGGIRMNAPLYMKTDLYTTPSSSSPYIKVTLEQTDDVHRLRLWKIAQTMPAPDTMGAVVQIEGPLYVDFTYKDGAIIKRVPGPSVVVKPHVGFEITGLELELSYNNERNSLDVSWKGRKARDLSFVLDLDGSEVIPTEVQETWFWYGPISEGSHRVVLSVYDRLMNQSGLVEGEFSVNLGAPEIKGFAYIRDDDVFSARIADKGTALRDLELEFYLNGVKSLFEFDRTTGQLTGLLYDKPQQGTVTAQVFVTDKAGNRVSSIAQAQFYTTAEGTTEASSVSHASVDLAQLPIGVTVVSGDDNCIMKYQRRDQCWVTVTEECSIPQPKIIGFDGSNFTGIWKGTSDSAEFGAGQGADASTYFPTYGMATLIREKQHVDMCPPVISDLRYDEASHTVRAVITDASTRLDRLRIEYGCRGFQGYSFTGGYWGSHTSHFHFSPASGQLIGEVPRDDSEIYYANLSVHDWHNYTFGGVTIRIPKKPPDVSLYFDEFSGSSNQGFLNSLGLEHLLVGEYSDISGIDESRTELEIDGVIKKNYLTYPHGRTSTMLLYRGDLAEGRHRARLRVADMVGLENETYLVFDITYKPHIYNFVYQGNIESAPVFVAFIKDQGFDVTLEGITLVLDGVQVPRDQCYYNPETGFFSVSGPIEITEGPHRAKLAVIDSTGNRAEEELRFGGPQAVTVEAEAVGGVRVSGYSVWDYQGNIDGRVNPGERVRLFVEIISDCDITGAQGVLRITHPYVTIERDRAGYGDIPEGVRTEPLGGFDLVIRDEFFVRVNATTEEVDCTLTLTDHEGREWVLPFKITVFRPLEIFRDSRGPTEGTSVSLEVVQPEDGIMYSEISLPEFIEGRFLVRGSTISTITITINGHPLPVSINDAAGTFVAPLNRHPYNEYLLQGLNRNIMIVTGRNSVGDETEVIVLVSFFISNS